ncbi:MAG TPA: lysine--tRNA ligase [Candidatus Paceibacterota bacterium]|nr:lysine--tRNA ligase [Candidatus Paceibacterota bacterium]
MLEDIIAERRKKLERIREAGINPYPARAKRSFSIGAALERFEEFEKKGEPVSLVGRVRALRDQGKIMFADLEDGAGKIQAVFRGEELKDIDFWRGVIDLGDFVSVTGPLFMTQRGERSIAAHEVEMASKSLSPLPDRWEGLEDVETRLRERYLDLIMHPEVKDLFVKKAIFWTSVREFLEEEGFLEVETSVLEPLAGGAEAEPFVTHHNALDTDFFLRISLELQLKKLVTGGFEKVFEIGRVFRNEGIDREHLQDFTFMECYWAYHNCGDMMKLMERMFKFVIEKTAGSLQTSSFGHHIDWGKPWKEVDYVQAFKHENGLDPIAASRGDLHEKAVSLGLKPEDGAQKGRLIDLIYKKTVRPKLIEPCFLVGHPIAVSPLSKSSPENPEIAERFQIVACGSELGNGYSELNDPIDQRRRFEDQMRLREKGDKEAMRLDEDFLRALEYGMPPTAGFGMSERTFAVLMDKPVRETVFFPLMRPKQ